VTKEDIERTLIEARWKLDDGFSGHLMIDEDHATCRAWCQVAWAARDPAFELRDGEISYLLGSECPDAPASRDAAYLTWRDARGRAG
jgi:hypothetical protein